MVQEAFLSIWKSGERYDPDRGSAGAWCLGIVRNRAIDMLRSKASKAPTLDSDDDGVLESRASENGTDHHDPHPRLIENPAALCSGSMAAKKSKASKSKASRAGAAIGLAGRGVEFAKRVDWPAVWLRAQWLSHHTKRLYNNLSEDERREFMRLVVPTKDQKIVPKEDRGRVQELVAKAFTGK